jgi:homoserine kinase
MSRRASTSARVRVPGSTSNLGAGFDCVGMAVDLWLAASVVVEGDGAAEDAGELVVTVRREGTLASLAHPGTADLTYVGFAAACAACARPLPHRLDFSLASDIPVARGLGSSAAAIVAGAALANAALDLGLGARDVATLCARIEGHPDNAGAAVFGGAVLGVTAGGAQGAREYAFSPLAVHAGLAFVFAVPDFEVTTAAARAVLPPSLPYTVAVAAAAKSAALVQGLATGDGALLASALDDVLHVPYRREIVRDYAAVVGAARAAGAFGATLSGSGSAIVAIAPRAAADRIAAAMCRQWGEGGVGAGTIVTTGAGTVTERMPGTTTT